MDGAPSFDHSKIFIVSDNLLCAVNRQGREMLRFQPFNSAISTEFWAEYSRLKLSVWGLKTPVVSLSLKFALGQPEHPEQLPALLNFDANSLSSAGQQQHSTLSGALEHFKMPVINDNAVGLMLHTNTLDEFKALDFADLMRQCSEQLWQWVTSGEILKNPKLLTFTLLVAYGGLKKHRYYYWMCMPVFLLPDPATLTIPAAFTLNVSQVKAVQSEVLKYTADGVFVAEIKYDGDLAFSPSCAIIDLLKSKKKVFIVYLDPGTSDTTGWSLRNLLVTVKVLAEVEHVNVVSVKRYLDGAYVTTEMTISLPGSLKITDKLQSVGWGKNSNGKLAPRSIDLASSMNPTHMADVAANLNLQLMRWRLAPDLNLDVIAATKVLVLGAGTLGCYLARSLMGWGVRDITFVDNGTVSMSNLVRQPLFIFADYQKPKAETAANNMKLIHPAMRSVGVSMSVPMPGHEIINEKETRQDIKKLVQLVRAHDVVFLMMDSRESRWLPSIVGAAEGKIVINVALGFDTFVVMRHGMRNADKVSDRDTSKVCGNELGCYFCNDVVAPTDSFKNRTLDQECTVTRPGLAPIASALSAELMVSLLQHKGKAHSPAETSTDPSSPTSTTLGTLPHTIRGFLSHFTLWNMTGKRYEKCTACSDVVLKEYAKGGVDFIVKCLQNPAYLEDVCGLTEMRDQVDLQEVLDFDDWDEETNE